MKLDTNNNNARFCELATTSRNSGYGTIEG